MGGPLLKTANQRQSLSYTTSLNVSEMICSHVYSHFFFCVLTVYTCIHTTPLYLIFLLRWGTSFNQWPPHSSAPPMWVHVHFKQCWYLIPPSVLYCNPISVFAPLSQEVCCSQPWHSFLAALEFTKLLGSFPLLFFMHFFPLRSSSVFFIHQKIRHFLDHSLP